MANKSCLICGSTLEKAQDTEFQELAKCRNPGCGHIFSVSAKRGAGVHSHSDGNDELYAWRNAELVKKLTKLNLTSRGSRVLDVGAGRGNIASAILEHADCSAVVCVEKSKEDRVELNRKRLRNHGSLSDVARNEAGFDLILLIEVIEHVDDPVAFLKRLKELLSENGVIFITTPAGVVGAMPRSLLPTYYIPEHIHFFSMRSIKCLCSQSGLAEPIYLFLKEYYQLEQRSMASFFKNTLRFLMFKASMPLHYTLIVKKNYSLMAAKALIFEPHCSGHRMDYVRVVVEELRASVDKVYLLTLDYVTSEDLLAFGIDVSASWISHITYSDKQYLKDGLLFGKRPWLSALRGALSIDVHNYVVVPFFDDYFLGVHGFLFPRIKGKLLCVVVRPASHTSLRGIAKTLALLLLMGWIRLLRGAEFFVVEGRPYYKCIGASIVDDPVDDAVEKAVPPAELSSVIQRLVKKPVLLVFGTIDRRKLVKELLSAFDKCIASVCFNVLIVGKWNHFDFEGDEQLSNIIDDLIKMGRLYLVDRFVTREEKAFCFEITSVVSCAYNETSENSGALAHAVHYDKPVLVVRNSGLGSKVTGLSAIYLDSGDERSFVSLFLENPSLETVSEHRNYLATKPESVSSSLRFAINRTVSRSQ